MFSYRGDALRPGHNMKDSTMNPIAPAFAEYVREKTGGPMGTCLACRHDGAMLKGMTGYECPECRSPRIEFKLVSGKVHRQFVEVAG